MAGSNTGNKPTAASLLASHKQHKPHAGGRPTKMTEMTVKKLEEAFAIGASDQEACFYADISKETLYTYQDKHPKFVDRKKALKQRPVLLARQTVVKALETDSTLAMKYLERKRKKEFSARQELTGKDGERLGVTVSADQAEQLIRARARRNDI